MFDEPKVTCTEYIICTTKPGSTKYTPRIDSRRTQDLLRHTLKWGRFWWLTSVFVISIHFIFQVLCFSTFPRDTADIVDSIEYRRQVSGLSPDLLVLLVSTGMYSNVTLQLTIQRKYYLLLWLCQCDFYYCLLMSWSSKSMISARLELLVLGQSPGQMNKHLSCIKVVILL